VELIYPSYEILSRIDGETLSFIESIGRVCYKSEHKIREGSDRAFAQKLLLSGHESVIEHVSLSVRFIIDRGISHELVRHRMASFSQESTRYVSYKHGCVFIIPPWINVAPGVYKSPKDIYLQNLNLSDINFQWVAHLFIVEEMYKTLIEEKWSPQEARSVLPNCLKTELIMTANLREWRHIIKMRTAKGAHPQVIEIVKSLHHELREKIPVIFDIDI
jgi:thymidylate synthase (FAD)